MSIFIRALTSDINEIEAAKRSKTSKNHMEERLARGFVLLRYPTEGNLESCQIYERNSELKYFSKCLLITQKSMFKFKKKFVLIFDYLVKWLVNVYLWRVNAFLLRSV